MADRGRTRLTEAEKEERRLEKEAEKGTKRPYKRKDKSETTNEPTNDTTNMSDDNKNNTPVENTENTGTNNNEGGGDNNQNTNVNNDTNQNANNSNEGGGGGTGSNEIGDGAKFQPNKLWKPFSGDRIKRSYSTPNINQELLNTEIPEVNISSTSNDMSTDQAGKLLDNPLKDADAEKAKIEGPKKPTPVNPDWNALTPEEQRNAAALTTDMFLGVYDKLHYFGREFIKVDEEEIIEMHNDDKIDMQAPTVENEDDPDKEVSIQEFWQDFNKQVDDKFVVSDKFKAEIRPPLERLCMKYGLGASDGLYVAYKFGEDAATKLAMLVGFKKTVNKMHEHFQKNHSKFKAEVQKGIDAELAKRARAQKAQELKLRAIAAGLADNASEEEIVRKETELKKEAEKK